MGIAGHAIFGFGLTLQVLLLWRSARVGLHRFYPFFLSYLVYTILASLVNLSLRLLESPFYALTYWLMYMAGSVFRFGVTWEIFRQIFPRGSALRRISTTILVAVLCALAAVFYSSGPRPGTHFIADFTRKINLSVTICVVVALVLAPYYRISLGRNIWGMAIGLLAYVSSQLANFAAIDISPAFQPYWSLIGPCGFILMLLIWTFTLWSYVPNPSPVVADESVQREALSEWQHRWSDVGTAIRKAIKP